MNATNKRARRALIVIAAFAAIALFAPFIASDSSIVELSGVRILPVLKVSAFSGNLEEVLAKPSAKHLLGTDAEGRDVLAQLVWAMRLSLGLGLAAGVFTVILGATLGALAGYFKGWVDAIILRFIESFMCFPALFLILALLAFIGPSVASIIIVLGITGWTQVARLVRAEMLRLHPAGHVLAAKALGAGNFRIVMKHMLPFAIIPALVAMCFAVAGAVMVEAGLSFLGFGVSAQIPSLGRLLSEGQEFSDFAWWLTMPAGLEIFAIVFVFNRLGESIREKAAMKGK